MYTMQDWERDGSLKLTVGQIVSDEVVNELINCVPPAYHGAGLFQCGEAACTEAKTYEKLYDTYRQKEEGWEYLGHCRLGKTKHRESYEEVYMREQKARREYAASLTPQMVGDLYFTDRNGEQRTPGVVYFAVGYERIAAGEAFCHYDNALCPVYLCRNGERLQKPDWAGFDAKFKGGFLFDFRNAW